MPSKKRKREGKKGGEKARRSRYVGVSWNKAAQKWMAQIQVAGVTQHLGCFDDEADGARVYDAAVAAQNLPYPRNFPGDSGAKQAKKAPKCRNNLSAIPNKGASRFHGVSWNKKNKKWKAATREKGKMKFIGLYEDETAAARAFDAYVIPNNIDKNLNFPDAPAAAGHRPTKQNGSSRHRGVCWNKMAKKWRAQIRVGGKRKYLGSFVNEDDAGRTYDTAVRKYFPDEEKPQNWKGYNFTATDGEEGCDDGDDTRSARRASSRGEAAIDASDDDEENASSAAEEVEERPRRRRRGRTATELPATTPWLRLLEVAREVEMEGK